MEKISNKRLSDEEFFRERREVLAQWPTGKEVDLDEAIDYHKSMPSSKNYALKLTEAKRQGEILLHAAEGANTLERHIEFLQAAQDEGQADFLTTWIGALTRTHRYAEAEEEVREAERTGKVILNDFPIVHYGVPGVRQVVESVKLPISTNTHGPDTRLITEIALAGGFTATVYGAFSAFWNAENLPLETVIRNYQYNYRLAGYYEERGIPINVTSTGALSGTIGPSLLLTPSVIGALIAAEQGVKHLHVVGGGGNLVQDVASVIIVRKLAREYLDRFGHRDVQIACRSNHPGGKWPTDAAQVLAVRGWASVMAVLAGCEVCGFVTAEEWRQNPRKESCAATLRYMRMVLNLWKDQKINLLSNKDVLLEIEMTERESRAILDRVIELGDGDVVVGSVRAVECGVLDQAFATNRRTLGKVKGVRDAQGAFRYLDHGNLPFTRDIVEFHKEKIAERAKKEGREIGDDVIISDMSAPSRGYLMSGPDWPTEKVVTT